MEKQGVRVLSRLEYKMPDEIKVNYLLLKNTIAMHRDDINESERLLDEVSAVNRLEPDTKINLYNDYAIIYSNKAYENSDPGLMKKALKNSERAFRVLKDYQMISELPLAATNLASFYMSCGKTRKAKRAYLEGLYYGQDIDHPVEVPYTKSRIAFAALAVGACRLALKISEEVIKSDVGDIKSAAYTIRYLYGNGKKSDLKKAYELSKRYEEFGTGKCWWEMLGVMSSKAINDNDTAEIKKIREKLVSLRNLPQRQVMKFNNELNIQILGVLTGISSDVKKLEETSAKLEKIGSNRGLLCKAIYSLGMHSKDISTILKARKIALATRSYPFVLRIEEQLRKLTGDENWDRKIKVTKKRLEQMNRTNSIEELLNY